MVRVSNIQPTSQIQPVEPFIQPSLVGFPWLCTAAHTWHWRLARAPRHWVAAQSWRHVVSWSSVQVATQNSGELAVPGVCGSMAPRACSVRELWPGSGTAGGMWLHGLCSSGNTEPGGTATQSPCPFCSMPLALAPSHCPNMAPCSCTAKCPQLHIAAWPELYACSLIYSVWMQLPAVARPHPHTAIWPWTHIATQTQPVDSGPGKAPSLWIQSRAWGIGDA